MATNVDIATLTAKLALDAKNFNAGIDTATQKLGAVTKDNAWSKLGESLNSVAKVATVTGGAIVGMAGITVKAATDFESAFTGVKKTINFEGTQAEADAFFAGIRQDILDMSSVMPIAAEEIAGVYEAAGQLGIQNENLTNFATAMIGLGSATNMSANEAAVALAQFANVTQMAQTDFDRLGSSIVELGNNMATDERQITSFATELAVLATSAGFSEADILGLGAAMASMGLESAASGTAMQRLSQDMISAVYSMNDSYEGFQYTTDMTFDKFMEGWNECGTSLDMFAYVSGMTAEEFSKAWQEDATSAFMAFIKGLSSQSTADQLTIFDVLDIKQMREIDMLQRLSGNYELVETAIQMSNNAWNENSALSEEVAKRNADTASQLQMLKNDLSALAIEAGTALLPVVRELLEQAKPLIEKATEWIKNNPEAVVQLTKTGAALLAIGTAVSGVINVVTAIGSFITTVKTLGGAISILTGGGAAAGAAAGGGGLLAGLGAGIAAIGPVVLGIGAIVGGFALAWKNDWLGCKTHMSEAVETFKKKKEETGSTLQALSAAVKTWTTGVSGEITNWWNSTIQPWLSNIWNHITQWFTTAKNNISNWLTGAKNDVVNFFTGIWNHITNWFSQTGNNITNWFTTRANEIRNFTSNILNTVLQWFSNLGNNIVNWFSGKLNDVRNFFTNIINNVSTSTSNILNTVTNWFSNLGNNIVNWFNQKMNDVRNFFSNVVNNVSSSISNIWNNVTNGLNNIGNNVTNWLNNTRNNVSNWFSNLWNTISNWFNNTANNVRNYVSNIWNNAYNILNNAVYSVGNVFSNIWNNISNYMNNIKNTITNAWYSVTNVISSITNAVSDAWNSVRNFASNAWNGLTGRASGGPVFGNTPYLVGEAGPELFVPNSSGYIIDAEETMELFRGGSRDDGITIVIEGDVYDDEYSMRRKLRSAVLDVIETELAYG